MAHYAVRPRARKPFRLAESQLDLFLDSAPQALPALISSTLAETRIAQRFGVSPSLARAIAELANIGGRA
mgnify:CR=1 FL=1